MRKTMVVLLLSLALLASACQSSQGRGAMAGGALGALAGGLIADNALEGALIGSGIGAAFGFVAGDIADRSAKQAALGNRPVEYTEGRARYEARPAGDFYYKRDPRHGRLRCRMVRERVWEDGRMVKNREREVCESRWDEYR